LTDSYGKAGIWCWLDFSNKNDIFNLWFILFEVYIWTNIVYNVIVAYKVSVYFKKREEEIKNKENKEQELLFLKKYSFMLKIFPLIMISTRLPEIINRVTEAILHRPVMALYLIHIVFFSLSGLFNSIIYSFFFKNVFINRKKITEEYNDNI
jgi:hypothetical protein